MIFVVVPERLDETQVIDQFVDMREQIARPRAALAPLLPIEGRFKKFPGLSESEFRFMDAGRQRLAIIALQQRLIVV